MGKPWHVEIGLIESGGDHECEPLKLGPWYDEKEAEEAYEKLCAIAKILLREYTKDEQEEQG